MSDEEKKPKPRKRAPKKANSIPLSEIDTEALPVKKSRPNGRKIDINQYSADTICEIVRECSQYLTATAVTTKEELVERVTDFFYDYSHNGCLPSIEKLSVRLGVTTKTLKKWYNGETRPEFQQIMTNVMAIFQAIEADLAITGKMNPVVYIFRGKNYYQMTDRQEIVVERKNVFAESVSREEIESRLLEDTTVIDADFTEKP